MPARHRAFIAPRLLGSLIALGAFPAYIAVQGAPGPLELVVFAWLVAPMLISYFLSRTGRYESAYILSAVSITALVTLVAVQTGGIGSFAAIWLLAVPIEAGLSASRRVVGAASAIALAAAALLAVMTAADLLPLTGPSQPQPGALAAVGIVSAGLYATGLAFGADSLSRASVSLLQAEEDRYGVLLRHMDDLVTRHNRTGAVLFASEAAGSMLGTAAQGLLGHGLFDRVHVADRPAFLSALADAAALGETRAVEFRVRRDDAGGASTFVWVEMRCRPLERASGAANDSGEREVVAVTRDISERKAREQASIAARAEAEQADAAKTRFLATMSHELRTPLNVVIGFSEMLIAEDKMQLDAARRREYAQLINDSGHHLLSVVNGILDMSKIDNGRFEINPEPFAPAPVIVNCCDLLALQAGQAGLEVTVDVPELPEIVADKRAVKQILLNLLANAIKFTNRGGRITVRARAEPATMLLSVEDNGIGIGEDDLPRIGDPFFQARSSYDRSYGGSGLGLSIVKGLVDLHGGDVEICSRVGEGTRVLVRLPLSSKPRGAQTISIARSAADQARSDAAAPVKKSA